MQSACLFSRHWQSTIITTDKGMSSMSLCWNFDHLNYNWHFFQTLKWSCLTEMIFSEVQLNCCQNRLQLTKGGLWETRTNLEKHASIDVWAKIQTQNLTAVNQRQNAAVNNDSAEYAPMGTFFKSRSLDVNFLVCFFIFRIILKTFLFCFLGLSQMNVLGIDNPNNKCNLKYNKI